MTSAAFPSQEASRLAAMAWLAQDAYSEHGAALGDYERLQAAYRAASKAERPALKPEYQAAHARLKEATAAWAAAAQAYRQADYEYVEAWAWYSRALRSLPPVTAATDFERPKPNPNPPSAWAAGGYAQQLAAMRPAWG